MGGAPSKLGAPKKGKGTQKPQTIRRIRRRVRNVATTPTSLASPLTGSVPDWKTAVPKTLVQMQNLVFLPARLRAACFCVVCEESAYSAFKNINYFFRNPKFIVPTAANRAEQRCIYYTKSSPSRATSGGGFWLRQFGMHTTGILSGDSRTPACRRYDSFNLNLL